MPSTFHIALTGYRPPKLDGTTSRRPFTARCDRGRPRAPRAFDAALGLALGAQRHSGAPCRGSIEQRRSRHDFGTAKIPSTRRVGAPREQPHWGCERGGGAQRRSAVSCRLCRPPLPWSAAEGRCAASVRRTRGATKPYALFLLLPLHRTRSFSGESMRTYLRRNVRYLWSRFLLIFSGTEVPGPSFRRVFSAFCGYRLAGTRGTAVPLCFSPLCRAGSQWLMQCIKRCVPCTGPQWHRSALPVGPHSHRVPREAAQLVREARSVLLIAAVHRS